MLHHPNAWGVVCLFQVLCLLSRGSCTVEEDEDPQLKKLVEEFRRQQEAARSEYPSKLVICPIVVVVSDSDKAELVAQAFEKALRQRDAG